jgi:hypothetical protein
LLPGPGKLDAARGFSPGANWSFLQGLFRQCGGESGMGRQAVPESRAPFREEAFQSLYRDSKRESCFSASSLETP